MGHPFGICPGLALVSSSLTCFAVALTSDLSIIRKHSDSPLSNRYRINQLLGLRAIPGIVDGDNGVDAVQRSVHPPPHAALSLLRAGDIPFWTEFINLFAKGFIEEIQIELFPFTSFEDGDSSSARAIIRPK
jgi:hypothetical protein